jgi:hypothetical protein
MLSRRRRYPDFTPSSSTSRFALASSWDKAGGFRIIDTHPISQVFSHFSNLFSSLKTAQNAVRPVLYDCYRCLVWDHRVTVLEGSIPGRCTLCKHVLAQTRKYSFQKGDKGQDSPKLLLGGPKLDIDCYHTQLV